MNALTVLFLASLALAAHGFPQPDTQIVGGNDAPEGAHPYIVSLQAYGNHFCGGSIIHKRYVVTAAHCLVRYGPHQMTVHAGSNHLNKPNKVYKVEQIIRHPQYSKATKLNDIGLIRLAKDIEFNEKVQPIRIADIYHVPSGEVAIAAGWGRLEAWGRIPNDLQEVELNVLNHDQCKRNYIMVDNSHICTYTQYGLGVCNGDSGGPLVANGELIGIVSFGRPCAIGYPDVYTRAYSFRDWIKQHIVD